MFLKLTTGYSGWILFVGVFVSSAFSVVTVAQPLGVLWILRCDEYSLSLSVFFIGL